MKKETCPEKTKGDYAEIIKDHLHRDDPRSALDAVRDALERFPSDPYFLSHYGCLIATVEKRGKEGMTTCEEALRILRKSKSVDFAFLLPLFYLNLGRSCLQAGKKKAAIEALQEGLKYDPKNLQLRSEIRNLGRRKRPVLPFLDRSNPLNKYLGKLRYRLQNKENPDTPPNGNDR